MNYFMHNVDLDQKSLRTVSSHERLKSPHRFWHCSDEHRPPHPPLVPQQLLITPLIQYQLKHIPPSIMFTIQQFQDQLLRDQGSGAQPCVLTFSCPDVSQTENGSTLLRMLLFVQITDCRHVC